MHKGGEINSEEVRGQLRFLNINLNGFGNRRSIILYNVAQERTGFFDLKKDILSFDKSNHEYHSLELLK